MMNYYELYELVFHIRARAHYDAQELRSSNWRESYRAERDLKVYVDGYIDGISRGIDYKDKEKREQVRRLKWALYKYIDKVKAGMCNPRFDD